MNFLVIELCLLVRDTLPLLTLWSHVLFLQFLKKFIRFLSIDLGISDSRGIVLTQKHLRGRLAETILHLRDNYGTLEDGETLILNLSREDLASLSNMTTSNAIRTLSQFATDGLVSVTGRSIRILDLDLLRRIAKYE